MPAPSSFSPFYGFSIEGERVPFPHRIYPMIIQSIRDSDAADGRLLLKRWTEGLDSQWEAIWRKIRDLSTLIDPERCPSKAVPYLGWIVGITSALADLVAGISESDYRQLIAIAVRMWKKKGSGLGLVETLRSISGYEVRYLSWFFFRMILDEFELGHAEFDVDAWLLDQPGMSPSIPPDSIEFERTLVGDVLPSAATPAWTYVNLGLAEGAHFSVSGGYIHESTSSVAGGYYYRDVSAELVDPETAEFAARFRLGSISVVTGRPWILEVEDGARGYRLRWNLGEIALYDVAGNLVAGPRSRAFVVGVEYAIRIARTGPSTVDFTIDGSSVFGEVDVAEFDASAQRRYAFGYRPEGPFSQSWDVLWKDVGGRPILTLDVSTLLGLPEAVPHDVRVVYQGRAGRTVPSYWTGARNEVSVSDALGLPLPLESDLSNYRVGVDPDEFVSDLRVVDDGTLDREFVARLVAISRPANERIFVRFVDFQDLFNNVDLRYWTEVSGTTTPVPSEGRAELEDGAVETVIHADMPLAATWSQFTLAAQFALRDEVAGKWGEVRFNVVDDENFYAVRFDPGARTVALQKVTAAVRSTLDSFGPMDVFHPDVLYVVHVTTEDVSGGVLMKYFLDGDYLGEATDADHAAGTIGLAVAVGQRLSAAFVDLVQCPFASSRVGPGIDAEPNWEQACALP